MTNRKDWDELISEEDVLDVIAVLGVGAAAIAGLFLVMALASLLYGIFTL